jgi:hypothetical protein
MEPGIIQSKIYKIRDHNVMLDFDLARLYEVTTKVLNQSVKRNLNRFPKEFMFRLTINELRSMRSQIVTASQKKRNRVVLPYAFTEHGVAMLASVLKSEKAIKMNIAIVKAFISLRQLVLSCRELAEEITGIRQTVSNHDEQLKQIYLAIERLLQDKEQQQAWKDRELIGFKKNKNP